MRWCGTSQWRIHRGQGTCPPDFRPGRQSCKSPPPTFLTHNEAIAGFTNQSLGLPAYACNTGSSTAIKLAPRMHQNLPLPQTPPPVGRGHLRRLDPRARHDSSPTFWTVDTPMAQVPCSRRHAGARRSMHDTKTTPSEIRTKLQRTISASTLRMHPIKLDIKSRRDLHAWWCALRIYFSPAQLPLCSLTYTYGGAWRCYQTSTTIHRKDDSNLSFIHKIDKT